MAEMTTKERMRRMYEHRDADRVPVTDNPWAATVERWHREGMPEDADVAEFLELDSFVSIGVDNSPRYPVEVVEETDEYVIRTTKWGQTTRNWKHRGSTPEHIACRVTTPEAWADAKKRMTPDRDRVDWERLKSRYPAWRESGAWIRAGFWFGFDITHSHMVGTETVLMAMVTDPEWVIDMINHELDICLALHEMVWDAGYEFDAIRWPDDMGYKLSQFFSLDMYREIVKPAHKRAADWAHARGCKVELHSCGDIRPFIPELIELGIDCLNPLEVKAGVDPVAVKEEFGDRLVLHGGLDAVLYEKPPEVQWAEMRRVIPELKKNGGYVASTDHSVPDTVSLERFREFVRLAKELGTY
ncbi:MAG: uroporphyrinogen decarboxylase family protein [Planctomycetota bacterium]|jgi:uroporphyrinogen decarboxylase